MSSNGNFGFPHVSSSEPEPSDEYVFAKSAPYVHEMTLNEVDWCEPQIVDAFMNNKAPTIDGNKDQQILLYSED